MQIKKLRLAGLQLIAPRVFSDERGYFFETYSKERYLGIETFVQDNVSFSYQNTIRGLHFQSSPGQAKLVSCLEGEIWDVAVDMRPESPTYMQWEAVALNDQNHEQFYLPAGFAHGFCVLSKRALVHYKVSSLYDPQTEKAIRWNDPDLSVAWPINQPILSPRDRVCPYFKEVQRAMGHR